MSDTPVEEVEVINNQPIEELIDGESELSLPISRIKKTLKLDPNHVAATDSAVYLTGVATELFIQNLTEQAAFVTKTGSRKKIQYKDFYQAIRDQENLNFLSDLVPKTYNLGDLISSGKARVQEKDQERVAHLLDKGQNNENQQMTAEQSEVKIADALIDEKQQPELPRGQQVLNFSRISRDGNLENGAETGNGATEEAPADEEMTDA